MKNPDTGRDNFWTETLDPTATHTHTHINGVYLNAVTTSLILGKSFWQISIYVKFGHNSEISLFTDWSHNLNIFEAYS